MATVTESPRQVIAAWRTRKRNPPGGAAGGSHVALAWQQDPLLVGDFAGVSQHAEAATSAVAARALTAQHPACESLLVGSSALAINWRAASATTYAGTSTPCRSAQASFSSCVMQQQSRQQASASTHPQGCSSQGNRSAVALNTIAGKGTPTAHAATPASVNAARIDRPRRRYALRMAKNTARPT